MVDPVSILTRPEGRVLPAAPRHRSSAPFCFNPHPARRPGATASAMASPPQSARFQSSPGPKAGCYPRIRRPVGNLKLFQSSPGPKAGCYYLTSRYGGGNDTVSILTRPEGRVLPRRWATPALRAPVSILTRPEGRVLRGVELRSSVAGVGFNPHPARRPGATGISR